MSLAILPYIAWIYVKVALWGNLALSDDRTNTKCVTTEENWHICYSLLPVIFNRYL